MDWFRMYGEFATDPKVQMMPEQMQRRLVMLLCLQCSNGIETFHETERETSIAFALRISAQELAETKSLFLRRGFIESDWTLVNWQKRQYTSDSSTARVRRHRESKKKSNETGETFQERSSNGLEQNRTEQNKKTLSGTPNESKAVQAEVVQVLDHLNAKAGKAYRPVESNARLIRARIAEGATVEEMLAVIDSKCAEWLNDPKMDEYLRPATLFAATNFAQYVGKLPALSKPAQGWWVSAGFGSLFEAESVGCTEKNSAGWVNGKRIEVAA